MEKKKIKKSKFIVAESIALATLSFSLFPISYSIVNSSKSEKVSPVASSKQADSTSTTASTSGFDYIPVANNVNAQPVSTSVGFLGINSDNNTLYLTSYEGVTVWQFNAVTNSMVQSYYQNVLSISDISAYTIKSWKYLSNIDVIAVILSDASGNNATVFGVKADTGLIYAPVLDSTGNPKPTSNMVTVSDGTNVLWENSSGQIIASIFGNYSVYSANTYLISFANGVSEFVASVRNVAVNIANAQAMVDSKMNTTDTYGSNSVKYTAASPAWAETQNNDAQNWDLQAVIQGQSGSNTNIAIFTDTNSFATGTSTGSSGKPLYLQQAVLVDDSLNPISNGATPIVYTFNKFIVYHDNNDIWTDASSLQKYGYIGQASGTNQSFVWLTSGVWNAATELTYNSAAKTLTSSKVFDLQFQSDQDVYTYSYDITENRLFTSNSYTSTNAAIGYVDFDDSTLSYQTLIPSTYKSSTGDIPISDILKFSPVASSTSIPQTPIVYFDPNNTTNLYGLYINGSTSSTVNLERKSYEDIQTEAESLPWYTAKSASSVTANDALQALVYDGNPLNGSFTNSVESVTGDDANGTLNVRYKTTYENWWDTSTSSSFYIETTITGMYATNGSSFSWVTVNNGNSTNDTMLKNQLTFKQSTYPSNVQWSDVSKYFCIPNIKNAAGQVITLTEQMITLTPDNDNGDLTIKVDYTSVLPTGLSSNFLVYQYTFVGFDTLNGYDHHLLTDQEQASDQDVVDFKNSIYPSELTLSQFFQYFITLGPSYSKNTNDWTFTTTPNIYNGTVIVSLEYTPTTTTLPSSFPSDYKNIVDSVTISGFKNVVDDFKNVKTYDYQGIKTADDIWSEYQNAVSSNTTINTTLSKLISVPYVSFSNLTITRLDSSTSDRLDLSVSVNPGTASTLIVNKAPFVFDDSTAGNFAANGLNYPYQISVNIDTVAQEFAFKKSDSSLIDSTNTSDATFQVDLTKESYPSLNSNMYANDVTVDDVMDLFVYQGFVLNENSISLIKNNQDGIVYVTINLISSDGSITSNITSSSNNSNLQSYTKNLQSSISDGSSFTKRIEITGLKKPFSPVYIAIIVSILIVILIVAIAVVIYLKVIRKNLNKFVENKQSNKYVSKLDEKDIKKQQKIMKKNQKKLIKKMSVKG